MWQKRIRSRLSVSSSGRNWLLHPRHGEIVGAWELSVQDRVHVTSGISELPQGPIGHWWGYAGVPAKCQQRVSSIRQLTSAADQNQAQPNPRC